MDVTAVGTRAGSLRVRDFAARHGIARVEESWEEMLAGPAQWDALIVAMRPDATPDVLARALALGVPVLVEKPIAWNVATATALCDQAHERVIVGFNRRFYAPVQAARAEAHAAAPLLAHLALPEGVVPPAGPDPERSYLKPFVENSCHGIDIARFVLGDLRIETVRRLRSADGWLRGLAAILTSARGDVVQFTGNWGTPANYSLSLHRPGRRFDLLPWEVADVYEGMDVIDPTDAVPIRRYVPKLRSRSVVDGIDQREKPGFVRQALELRAMIEGRAPSADAATLSDMVAVLELCEGLLGPGEEITPHRAAAPVADDAPAHAALV
jgi:predicted dehydrogenase